MKRLTTDELSKRLFYEKSLTDVHSTYTRSFPTPLSASALAGWTFMVLTIFGLGLYQSDQEAPVIASYLDSIIALTLTLASTFFGVAIAGFAIFASSLTGPTLDRMIENDHKEKISIINYLYSIFVYSLSALFSLFVVSFLYYALLGSKSPLIGMSHSWQLSERTYEFLLLAFAISFISQVVFVLSIVRSFIWNLHQLLLVIAAMSYTETSEKLEKT